MDLQITPKKLSGAVTPPPSKSQAHRLLIAAALAEGTSTLHNIARSQDIEATLRCVTALGGSWTETSPGMLTVTGIGGRRFSGGELPRLDCGESGSTLRFFIPIALAVAGGGIFTGHGRLMERPQGPYFQLFDKKGIFYEQKDGVLTVRGALTPGEYVLPGNVSSQFFTGLLFALPLLDGVSAVVSSTEIESQARPCGRRASPWRSGRACGALRCSTPPTTPLPPRWRRTGPRRPSGTPPIFWIAGWKSGT